MVGVAGWNPMCGVLGDGEEKGLSEPMDVLEVSSTPRVSTSRLSLSTTVPSARRACSKSSSVRETRRCERPCASDCRRGCRPPGNEVGGTSERGDGCRNREARVV